MNNDNKKLICFIGVMGSGKSFRTKKLCKEDKNFVEINVADSLRNVVWKVIGWKPPTEERYELFKESMFISSSLPSIRFSGRDLLQRLGTEGIRSIDSDFWINAWKNSVYDSIYFNDKSVVCSDVRFTNEVYAALELENKNIHVDFVFCDYKSNRYDSKSKHESEKLAQWIKKTYPDLKDGDIIPKSILYQISKNPELL
nr:MAG TPA: deoxynucleoside monophosphate kinase [Caudoviricetes sp.]